MDITVGSVVESIKGRDTGNLYVVYKLLDDEYCLLVDGFAKKLQSPKKKKIKHIEVKKEKLESIAKKFNANTKVFDSEINSALRMVKEKLAEDK